MNRPHARRLRLRNSLGSFLSIAIILSCLVWPHGMPGRPDSQAVGLGAARAAARAEAVNFIDSADFFVRQHYVDFLSRVPDPDGFKFWTDGITTCGNDAPCAEAKRIHTSAAFFLSIEFQETGYLVYRFYKAAYGNIPAKPVPVTREEFMPDTLRIGSGLQVGIGDWQQRLQENKSAFSSEFVARERFASLYPATMGAAQFVDKLNANTGGALSQAERDALVNSLASGQMTRAQVVRAVAEDQTLKDSEFRKAFVLMEYFGYLRRNPDAAPDSDFRGFNFWLDKLNAFGGDFIRAEMVKAFISSTEYRERFAQPEMSAFGNPADPQLLRAVTAKGDVIDYFGEKNAAGRALSLKSVRVKNSANQVTNISLDSRSRPSRIQAFDGMVFDIEWLSDTNIVVTALSADGTIQVNVAVDLSTSAPPPAASSCGCGQALPGQALLNAQAPAVNRAPRAGAPIELSVSQVNPATQAPSPAQAVDATSSLVSVKRCGSPADDASVAMTVIPSSSPADAYTLPGAFVGSGQFRVSIPTQPSPGQDAEDICADIAGALGTGCDGLSALPPGGETQICALVGQAVARIHPVAGGAVFVVCEGGFAAARLYCDTLGAGAGPGAPSLLELMCGGVSEVVDRFAGGEVRLIPVVFIPGKGVLNTGGGATAPATGPFPNFNVDAGNKAEITSFTTSPADPAPGQGYVAEALIHCAAPNTQVTVSIAGTDGYTDSRTVTISGDAKVTLSVPGAEEGVVDTVTVAVKDGPTRQVVLVF